MPRYNLFIGVLALVLSACSAITPTPTTTPQLTLAPINALDCTQIDAHTDPALLCVQARGGVLLQAVEGQHTLPIGGINITLDGALYLLALPGSAMMIAGLEGTGVIGSGGVTRILQPGNQVVLDFDLVAFTASGTPSEVAPFDTARVRTAPIYQLERTITLPEIRGVTNTVENAQDCPIPSAWTGFYTVEYGDTLTRIAGLYDLTIDDLQRGNCITNPTGLFPGDILRVPPLASNQVEFTAEQATISSGACTTLSWRVVDAQVVYLDGNAVAHESTYEICPTITTTYTLLVLFENGEQTGYTQRINVE